MAVVIDAVSSLQIRQYIIPVYHFLVLSICLNSICNKSRTSDTSKLNFFIFFFVFFLSMIFYTPGFIYPEFWLFNWLSKYIQIRLYLLVRFNITVWNQKLNLHKNKHSLTILMKEKYCYNTKISFTYKIHNWDDADLGKILSKFLFKEILILQKLT